MNDLGQYQLESFPSSRIATFDIGAVSRSKHYIHAFIELDVTDARKMLNELKRQKQAVSFNAWVIKCISKTVEDCRTIHGIKKGKRNVILFEDIDVATLIERNVQGEKVPLPYLIRKTNEKSIVDICNEIKSGQQQDIQNEGNYVLGQAKSRLIMKAYYAMPGFIRRLIWQKIIRSPFLAKKYMGTVIVTSVGMMGKINGWVTPLSVHPLSFAVGSIIKKPGVKDGRIEIREYLHLTASVDHDVIDGAPAVRALSRLAGLIENGYGLS